MEITVYDLTTHERVAFCMLPERITTRAEQSFLTFNIMQLGEVRIPSGEKLTQFSWSGMLPGEGRRNAPYVSNWKAPHKYQEWFSGWKNKNHKLRLTVTGTPINHAVYLADYSCEESGGAGDLAYSVSFIQAKDIKISATKSAGKPAGAKTKSSSASPKKTHTVVVGDTLWSIAQQCMGDGSKYPQLYAANKEKIDANNKRKGVSEKYMIWAGTVLMIP